MDITVPTVKGVKDALKSYGAGALGGLVYGLANKLVGNDFLGGLISAVLAGSMIPGAKGDTIALMAGFAAGQVGPDLLGIGGGGGDQAAAPSNVL